ncbi:MAG: hypothetical protein N4J56_006483 [Chroococcidiopsis sp. SAG 2025]|uniref:hypothetical protein n=1 Tax=Chroococcidiopsis sp. SAG 2025 TaxID=171389 RepID=UPI00293724EB|nr:hypothetical protein [Chroococcidiopsis sp. SAG 2025]MDV2996778.1 hypothetical protein [Chroococcidiopsis sp. SAG 2025]
MAATTKSQVIMEAAKVLNGRVSSRKDPNLNLAILEGRLRYLCQDLAEDRVKETFVRVRQIIVLLFVKKQAIREISLADLIRTSGAASILEKPHQVRAIDPRESYQKLCDASGYSRSNYHTLVGAFNYK